MIDNVAWTEHGDVVEPVVKHEVSFNSDGGSVVESQTINEGSKANRPVDPTKEGFDFLGWFIGENEFDFDTLITEAITLTAHWEEAEPVVEYTITFYDDEGILLETLVVVEGEMPSPQTPTKAETATHKFEFDGWDPELVVASEDAIYHATFKATEKGLYDYTETFDASTATGQYGDGTFTGVNGVTWTFVHARDEGDFTINGKGIMLRHADDPSSLSATFANGVKEISFQYRKAFTGGTARKYAVDVTRNGTTTTYDLPEFGAGSGAQTDVYTFSQVLNLTGEVTIKIYATGADGNQQMVIDNFIWVE